MSDLPIIIDLGSSEIRLGYSREMEPKIIFPNYIGEPKYNKILKVFNRDNEEIKERFLGNDCSPYLGIIKLRYPVQHGVFIKDTDISLVFNYIYKSLDINKEQIKNHQLLLTEPLLNPNDNREKIASILFEKYQVPGLYFATQPILSLFAASSTSGTILESGDGVTQVCSVFDGYSIPSSFIRYNYGGRDITEYLQQLLKKRGHHLNSDTEYLFVKNMKEKFCYSSTGLGDYSIIKKSEINKTKVPLPDCKEIILDSEKNIASQVLFLPAIAGKNCLGVHQMVVTSIGKVDLELRTKLYSSIILSGGNSLLKTFGENVHNEVKNLVPRNTKVKTHTPQRPTLSAWTGGSIITSLELFKDMWVTQKDWEENGKNIIHNKAI